MDVLTGVLAADRLHLILLPTEACNFRCTYCYEDFRLGRMGEDVVRGVEALLTRRAAGLSRLDISWFGGEPMIARDVVLRILRHVEGLRAAHPSLRFASDMTTNGYFLDRGLFGELRALGVTRYQVSFDGPPSIHDARRVRLGGGGSFARLWSNLMEIRDLPDAFTIALRLHVDRDNLAACPAFLKHLKHDFGGDPRFPLFPRLLSRWGGPGDKDLHVFEGAAGVEALRRLERLARELGVPVHEEAGGRHPVCYAARGNSFVVRADGRINKCTLALSAPANQVGRLSPDGRVTLDAERMKLWMRGLWSGSEADLRCPMKGLAERAAAEVA